MPCPDRRDSVLRRTRASVFLPWPEGLGGVRWVLHVCLFFGISQCNSGVLCKTRTQNHFLLSVFFSQETWISLKPEIKGHCSERHLSIDFSIVSFWGCGNLFPSSQELVSHCQDYPVENKHIQSYVYMVMQYNQRSTCIACLLNCTCVLRIGPFFSHSSSILQFKCKYSSVSALCWQFCDALLVDLVHFTSSFILQSCMKNIVAQTV